MIETISAKEAIARVGDPDTVFIDVREPQELARTGVLPGAVLAPLSRLQALTDRRNPEFQPVFASGRTLVFYCASGKRSAAAAEGLARMGIPRTVNLAGGIVAWQAADGPLAPA